MRKYCYEKYPRHSCIKSILPFCVFFSDFDKRHTTKVWITSDSVIRHEHQTQADCNDNGKALIKPIRITLRENKLSQCDSPQEEQQQTGHDFQHKVKSVGLQIDSVNRFCVVFHEIFLTPGIALRFIPGLLLPPHRRL